MKFIHLTDPHMTTSGSLFSLDIDDRLRRAVASINRHHGDAALCMVTGDMTNWGEPGAYTRCREILDGLSMPWHPLMGNHDIRENYMAGFPDALRDRNGFAQYVLETDTEPFIALDTMHEGTHAGYLDAARLDWLDATLAKVAPAGGYFLFMHHAPMVTGLRELDAIRLQNADALEAMFERHAPPRHLFFGHMHRPCHGNWRGMSFSTLKSTCHQVYPDFTGETALTASKELPSYAVVLLGSDSVVVHDISYLEEDLAFSYDRDDGKPPM